MKKYTLKNVLLFLATLSFPTLVNAREGIIQDFSYYVENAEVEINIAKDGSHEDLVTESYVITKENAKSFFGPFKTSFDPSHEDVSVVEAYVMNDGQKIMVDKNNIHKSNMAARKDGIVDRSELAIPYSQIKVGSIVYFKLLAKYKAGPFGDYFNFRNIYGAQTFSYHDSVKIKSPKELFYTIQDPHKVLTVKTSRDSEGNYILESQQTRLFSYVAVNEIGKISEDKRTFLTVTNVETWDQLRKMIQEKFVSVQLKDSTPQALLDVVNKIPQNDSFENKVNKALIYITSNYDYLGDWRGDGGFIPKSLNRIVADRFGDCKDFSTLLINLLRGMNIKADYAVVNRSFAIEDVPERSVPMMDYFNHMIVRVENEGKVYWIDPTNLFSVGVDVRGDISGRNALVLGDSKNPLEKIPDLDREKQFESLAKMYNFDSSDSATVDVVYRNQGETNKMIKDALKGKNETEKQAVFAKIFSGGERSAVLSFNQTDKKEKEYSDLNFKARYRANQLMIKRKDKNKNSLPLPDVAFLKTFLYFHQDGIGELDVRLAPNIDNVYFYKNIYLTGNYPNTCKIKSDWVEASRVFELRDAGIVVRDRVSFKKSKITNKEYGSKGFELVTSHLYHCFNEQKLDYMFNSKVHTDKLTDFEKDISGLKLSDKITKRIDKANEIMDKVGSESKYDDPFFDTARILLEKNLADKPNDSETFRALAAFYSSHSFVVGSTHDDFEFSMSTKYLDMAIQADPENLKAKIDFIRHLITRHMGVESKNLMSKYLSNIDDSKVDYETSRKLMGLFFRNHEMERSNKYMEMALKKAPNDDEKAFVYSSLADLNTTIDDYKKCTEYYEKSFQLNDKVAWNFGNAANCYNKIKMYDKAIELSRRAISLMDYGVAHSTLADSYVLKSEELFKNGKYKECEENLQLAKMEYPRADVFLSLVKVYLQTKQEEKAQEASKNALMAVDERYNKQWVSQNLLAITNYYKFQNQNVKRSIASEPEVKNKKLGNDK